MACTEAAKASEGVVWFVFTIAPLLLTVLLLLIGKKMFTESMAATCAKSLGKCSGLIGIVVQALTALSIFLSLFTASGGLQKSVCDSCPIVNVVDSTIAPFDSTGVTRYEGTATSCEDYVATQVIFPSLGYGIFEPLNFIVNIAFFAFAIIALLIDKEAHRLGDAVLLGSVFRAGSKSGDLPWMCGMSFGYAIIFGSVIFLAAEVEVGGAAVTGVIWLAGIVLVGVASASLSKCQSTTGSGPPDEECTHRLKSLSADLALAMIFACDAMFTMAKSRDSSFVAADNTWAAMSSDAINFISGVSCPIVMMKFWVNYKAFRKGGDGKLQKCIGMVAVFALLIEFGGACFWSLNGWEMQYRKPVFADSWPTPSAFPEAATDTCYPKADQPGFGVGAMQANCGVVGVDDGLAFWTNARCAGQEYVQHRYCTVFKQDSGDCLFNKLDQKKVMELFEQVHFPTASCPGLGGVTGTEKSAINWGTSYNPRWCEYDQSHGCSGWRVCAIQQSLYPWPEIATSGNIIILKQVFAIIALVSLVIEILLGVVSKCSAKKVAPK